MPKGSVYDMLLAAERRRSPWYWLWVAYLAQIAVGTTVGLAAGVGIGMGWWSI